MAILFRAATVSTNGTLTCTASNPAEPGDRVILQVRTQNDVTPTVPDGFTLVPNCQITGNNSLRIYSKIAGESEPSNYTVTVPDNAVRIGVMALYSDMGYGVATHDSASQSNSAASDYAVPSVTTTVPATLLTSFCSNSNETTHTASSGNTKRYDTGGANHICGQTRVVASAGVAATGNIDGSTQSSKTAAIAWAEVAPDAPAIPSSLGATGFDTDTINLSWTDNADDEDGFSIERSPDGSTGWTEIATVGPDVTSYADNGLDADTTYSYRVRAFVLDIYSGYSNTADATTHPEFLPPQSVEATAITPRHIQLTWDDPNDYESGYLIERSLSGVGGWVQIATVGVNVTSYDDMGLAPATTYYYRLRGFQDA